MQKRSKEEIKEYYKTLRERWAKAKELSETDQEAKAIYENLGKDFSYTSFYFTLMDMKEQNLEGIPYIDCKTFKGWIENGYKVKKGEKSKLQGITWVGDKKGENEDDLFIYPKVYYLFHKSQVEEIKK